MAKKPGKIVSQQKCRICGAKGKYVVRAQDDLRAMVCSACGAFEPKLFEVRVFWEGKHRRVTHNAQGQRLTALDHAEAALGEIRRQIETEEFNPEYWTAASKNELVWETFLAGYLKRQERRMEAGRITKATLDKRRTLKKHTVFFNGKSLRGIHAGHLEDWVDSLSLAPKTKLDMVREMGQVLMDALRRELIEKTPALPTVQVPKKSKIWLTANAQAEILEQIPQPHRPVFMFMFEYGCRPSEAMALQWQDIDWMHNTFTFRRAISRRQMGKATKQRRDNNLPIVGWFEGWLESHPRGLPEQPVFKNTESRKNPKNPDRLYTSDSLNKLWRKAVDAAEYDHTPLYNATRHSAGNQRRREGWDEGMIARLLGHASTKYVREFYVDTDAEMLRKNMIRTTDGLPANSPSVTPLKNRVKK